MRVLTGNVGFRQNLFNQCVIIVEWGDDLVERLHSDWKDARPEDIAKLGVTFTTMEPVRKK